MRAVRRWTWRLLVVAGLALAALLAWTTLRGRPQDLPWTPLDLGEPVGLFTGRKLAGLGDDFPKCRALLDRAGVRYTALAPLSDGQCGYADGVRLREGGARAIGFAPKGLGVACPVAAALAVWEWQVVQPAAQRLLGTRVTRIRHFGSYSCRRLYNRDAGAFSEHSTADAIDVAGFALADGRTISVVGDWQGDGDAATFLRTVRNGACPLFATVLSPDYNAAHRDHFHLDQAARGEAGWRACR
jgi:hypothetical protein